MRILVVGGAGYIGSHAVRALLRAGHDVRVLDNLVLGHAASLPPGLLIRGDLASPTDLEHALRLHQTDAVMHFAAFASVPESVADPARYYTNNLVGSLNLLDAMRAAGVARLVFSSTAATYGIPQVVPIPEDHPTRPINPYPGNDPGAGSTPPPPPAYGSPQPPSYGTPPPTSGAASSASLRRTLGRATPVSTR